MSSSPVAKKDEKKRVSKEKLRTIMEAASALTALGDEESTDGSRSGSPTNHQEAASAAKKTSSKKKGEEKRFLPDHKKPDAALNFPEKLMKMMRFAETQGDDYCVAWCEDGRSFVIRNCDDFTRDVVPKYFKPTKFSSFTRKLYRWGFRQINRGLGPDDPVIFGCAYFQRDAPEEMAHMRSVTAAGTRKETTPEPIHPSMVGAVVGIPQQLNHPVMQNQSQQHSGSKRALEDAFLQDEAFHKRLLLTKILQQQQQSLSMHGSSSLFNNVAPNSALAMASMQHPVPYQMDTTNNLKPYGFMGQQQSQSLHNQMHVARQNNFSNSGYVGEANRTADIVNAAIAALRNA